MCFTSRNTEKKEILWGSGFDIEPNTDPKLHVPLKSKWKEGIIYKKAFKAPRTQRIIHTWIVTITSKKFMSQSKGWQLPTNELFDHSHHNRKVLK